MVWCSGPSLDLRWECGPPLWPLRTFCLCLLRHMATAEWWLADSLCVHCGSVWANPSARHSGFHDSQAVGRTRSPQVTRSRCSPSYRPRAEQVLVSVTKQSLCLAGSPAQALFSMGADPLCRTGSFTSFGMNTLTTFPKVPLTSQAFSLWVQCVLSADFHNNLSTRIYLPE